MGDFYEDSEERGKNKLKQQERDVKKTGDKKLPPEFVGVW